MKRMPPSLTAFRTSPRATSAAEFARVMPLLLMLMSGIVVYGAYLAVVQQLAAEAERSSTAGPSDAERSSLARSCVTDASSYPLIVPAHLAVDAATFSSDANVFVTVNNNTAGLFIFTLPSFVPAPQSPIARSAANPRGDGPGAANWAPPATIAVDRMASSRTRAGLKTCLLAVAKVGW